MAAGLTDKLMEYGRRGEADRRTRAEPESEGRLVLHSGGSLTHCVADQFSHPLADVRIIQKVVQRQGRLSQ
jgi:hypothetical protein